MPPPVAVPVYPSVTVTSAVVFTESVAVIVDTPTFSAIVRGSALSVTTGAISSSVIEVVCC